MADQQQKHVLYKTETAEQETEQRPTTQHEVDTARNDAISLPSSVLQGNWAGIWPHQHREQRFDDVHPAK